jgi:hypothetical protein
MSPPFSVSKKLCLPPDFALVSFSAYSTLKMDSKCSSETSVDFQTGYIHGIMSQKIEIFINTAVRTSNPTYTVHTDTSNIFAVGDEGMGGKGWRIFIT